MTERRSFEVFCEVKDRYFTFFSLSEIHAHKKLDNIYFYRKELYNGNLSKKQPNRRDFFKGTERFVFSEELIRSPYNL
jgi:hypothetical protein